MVRFWWGIGYKTIGIIGFSKDIRINRVGNENKCENQELVCCEQ